MIYKKCVMTIDKNKATLDEDIYLYRLDKNIELYFTIVNNKYRFNKGDMNNIILITNASFFQVRLYKNAEIKYTFAIQPTDGGQAILTITDDLIDDPIEVGDYDFQISLLDEEKTSMISMPIVSKQLHVCEPLVSDDATMGKAVLGLSKLATGEIKNAFDSDGNYIREIHKDGDILSASIINKFEEALDTNTKAIKNGTGTSYDDTAIKNDIKTIKTDLGTVELTTADKTVKGAVNEVAAQYKDIANKTITTEERTKLTKLENYDDSTVKANIQNVQQQVNNLVLGAVGDGNNAEVVQARGTCATLNDRISPIESGFFNNKQSIYNILAIENIIATSMTADGLNNTSQWDVARGVCVPIKNMVKFNTIKYSINATSIQEYTLEILDITNKSVLYSCSTRPITLGKQELLFTFDSISLSNFYIKLYTTKKHHIEICTNTVYATSYIDTDKNFFYIPLEGDALEQGSYAMPYLTFLNNKYDFDAKLTTEINKILDPGNSKTNIVLNFEEPQDDFYLERQKLLDSYGFKGCFAFDATKATTEDLSDTQISRLHDIVNNGHEISIYGGSGFRPSDLTSNQTEWDAYIKNAISKVNEYGITEIIGYHCMNNQVGKALYNALIKNGFKMIRCQNCSDYGLDGTEYIKKYDKIATVLNTDGIVKPSEADGIKWHIDNCINNKWDYSLFGHDMVDVDSSTSIPAHQFYKSVLVNVLDYIKEKVDEGVVEVVTWSQLYNIKCK